VKGALAGALGLKSGAELPLPSETDPAVPDVDADDAGAEPNELEIAAAEEFQRAAKSGTPADLVRAFRGLKSACEAAYDDKD